MESIRVLIVDDTPEVRQELATLLRLAARTVSSVIQVAGEAQDGDEAVKRARDLRPDVILMDLEMPVMDGYEVTRRIKAEQPAVRVVILSIHSGLEEQQRAQKAGADGFITKGASYVNLLNAILGIERSNYPINPMEGENHE